MLWFFWPRDTKAIVASKKSHFHQPSATHARYKPAFSRFSQKGEPRFVVEIFGKIVKRQVCQKRAWVADGWLSRLGWNAYETVVGNSPPFLTPNLPFHDFPKYFDHESWFTVLGKSWKGRFVKNRGELPTAGMKTSIRFFNNDKRHYFVIWMH